MWIKTQCIRNQCKSKHMRFEHVWDWMCDFGKRACLSFLSKKVILWIDSLLQKSDDYLVLTSGNKSSSANPSDLNSIQSIEFRFPFSWNSLSITVTYRNNPTMFFRTANHHIYTSSINMVSIAMWNIHQRRCLLCLPGALSLEPACSSCLSASLRLSNSFCASSSHRLQAEKWGKLMEF